MPTKLKVEIFCLLGWMLPDIHLFKITLLSCYFMTLDDKKKTFLFWHWMSFLCWFWWLPGLRPTTLLSSVFGHNNKMEEHFSQILQLITNVNKLQDNPMSLCSMDKMIFFITAHHHGPRACAVNKRQRGTVARSLTYWASAFIPWATVPVHEFYVNYMNFNTYIQYVLIRKVS
jgi:hypothetical protein